MGEFWIDYRKAEKGAAVPKDGAGASTVTAGTLDALIAAYYKSAGLTSKAAATQRNYKSILEPFRKDHGDKPVALIKAKHIDAILGGIAAGSTAQAKNLRKRLSTLMKLAVKWEYRIDNPMLKEVETYCAAANKKTLAKNAIAKLKAVS